MGVQAPSSPLVMVSSPLPVPKVFRHPSPCSASEAPSGSGPTYWCGIRRAVGLAERVAAGDQRHGLLVVHRHPGERLPDVAGRGERARRAVGAFRVHVDEAHLHRGEGVLQLPVAGVALVAEPGVLGAPVHVLVGLPDVLTATTEAEGLEPHRLQRAVAGEDHQVGPGDAAAVLLLDRPEQPTRLVEVRVVRPAVEGCEPLHAGTGAAPAVADPVGARAVPRHPDEQRPVVPVVGRPPVLRRGHHGLDVLLEGLEVHGGELLGVAEVRTHRIGHGRVLAEDLQVEPVRPPVAVARTLRRVMGTPRGHRAPAFTLGRVHVSDGCIVLLGHGIPSGSGW